MTDRVLVRLASDGSIRRSGRHAGGAPASGAGRSRSVPVWVLVPAEDVLVTQATLSARNRTQLLTALPFAIEDQLLDPVEELHFAAGPASDGKVLAAVVAKATIRGWLEQLTAAGITADVLLPESLALPLESGNASALVDEDRAIVRLAADSAFTCHVDELPAWLAAANIDTDIVVHDARPRTASPLNLSQNAKLIHEDDALAFLARGLAPTPPLNLLDGEFAPRHKHARSARLWRVAAMLAATVVLLALAGRAADTWRLSRAAAGIETATVDTVRTTLPNLDAATLARSDPEQLMRERMQGMGAGVQSDSLLHLLGAIAPILGSTTRVQTRGMEYRNGTLELGLRSPDVATLDAMRERFAAQPGLDAEVTAANTGEAGIDGRIRIAGAKP